MEKIKPEPESSAWWICRECGAEWSAMMCGTEVPEICECGGEVIENS